MNNTNLFAPEDIAEIAEHLTLDDDSYNALNS